MKYVCLLRGINVGGKTIKMVELKRVFNLLNFHEVITLLTSGNVVFGSDETNTSALTDKIENGLKNEFGTEIKVIIRTIDYMQELINSDPFKNITLTEGLRLHVTFLKEKNKKTLVIPYESPDKHYGILSATNNELFVAVHEGGQTTDAMLFLEKKFGKEITTRTWNTVKKISMLQ